MNNKPVIFLNVQTDSSRTRNYESTALPQYSTLDSLVLKKTNLNLTQVQYRLYEKNLHLSNSTSVFFHLFVL